MPRLLAVGIGLIALAITTTTAYAASTRAEYVAQVDPICQGADTPLTKAYYGYVRALKKQFLQIRAGVPRRKASNEFFRRSARSLARKYRIYADETSEIARVVPAPGDQPTVSQWLAKRTESADLLNGAVLAARRHHWNNLNTRNDFSNLAEVEGQELVADFGFSYCVDSG